eukprot:12267949-Alexandrium_andersonii.AAC.1
MGHVAPVDGGRTCVAGHAGVSHACRGPCQGGPPFGSSPGASWRPRQATAEALPRAHGGADAPPGAVVPSGGPPKAALAALA